ncbi:gp53-like domain-containing protein, partial [Aeromonas finlandensis]|uniref:gp53-like domain-containing protein n=1 Tax=Aeromonas finlandensis TaxID=1543375 RepID=UPI003B98398E
ESLRGAIKIASQQQTNTGADDDVAITPKKLSFGFSLTLTSNTLCFVAPTWLGSWKLQCGYGSVSSTTANQVLNITFPTAFSEDVKANLLTHSGNGIASSGNTRGYIMSSERASNTGFSSSYSSSTPTSISFSWLAIGK